MAEFVGKDKAYVWYSIHKFAPQLDKLQQKADNISSEVPLDSDAACQQYWTKVGNNILDLTKKLAIVNRLEYITDLNYICKLV